MSANRQTFNQHVQARNISSSGALFSGLEHQLQVGDIVGVQFENQKTRCKVIWVMDTGCTPGPNQVSLFALPSYGGGCVNVPR